MFDIVVRDVVDVRLPGKEFRAVRKIDTDDQRTRFSRPVHRDARHQLAAQPECRGTVRRAFLHSRQGRPEPAHAVEVARRFPHQSKPTNLITKLLRLAPDSGFQQRILLLAGWRVLASCVPRVHSARLLVILSEARISTDGSVGSLLRINEHRV